MLLAAARAMHREEPPPHVLDDEIALALAGDEGKRLMERLRADVGREALLGFNRWACVRARVPEDLVDRSAIRQYVILGAGLDSFAYRRPDLVDRVRVFEVDQPASMAWKRGRLEELGVTAPRNLTYASVDFETQTLREGLAAADFDFTAPAIFSWIGVTMYLTIEAIHSTLETIAGCAPGSRVALTYNQPPSALQGRAGEIERALRSIADAANEPFLSLFVPEQIERLLADQGFVDITHFGPDEAVQTYFPGRSDVSFAGAQRIVIATVA